MKIASFVRLITILTLSSSCTDVVRVVTPSEIPEVAYCTTNATFASSYTISGTAYYKRRVFSSGLGAIDAANFPIRRAEVQVLNSSGAVVQCTETNATGNYSFTIPDDGTTYTVKILSRSYNQYNRASVLGDPTNNIPYSISQTFVASSSHALPNLTAEATNSDLRGGAFNILDQIYKSNDYLLNNTTGAFTVDHKAQVYWTKGVNPVIYFGGDPNSGVSFYIPGTDRLYILGGIDGDITVEDTDHFDNSVIVHEFGHFVEDNYSKSDSPGGPHSGQYVIDPRLAWSEGFATYLSTKVLADPIYRDTVGITPTTSYAFFYNAQTNTPSMDMPTAGQLGEGGFRELAVLRSLWAATNALMPFTELWARYTNEFKNTQPFREMSLFLQKQAAAGGATNITGLYPDNDKELDATRRHYGAVDNAGTANTPQSAPCNWTITPADPVPVSGNTFDKSNQFYSNDFFYYSHPGGTLSVALVYDFLGGTIADLDLYIYKDGYEYGVGNDLLTYSNQVKCGSGSCESGSETVNVSAPAGNYMVNVMYYNHAASNPAATYNLTIGSNLICR